MQILHTKCGVGITALRTAPAVLNWRRDEFERCQSNAGDRSERVGCARAGLGTESPGDRNARGRARRSRWERDELLRDAVAHMRLRREYHVLRRWLIDVVRYRYGLTAEDCEEVVDDVLLAWHRRLSATGALRNDRAFCVRVARSRAIERLRRKSVQTVELSTAEHVGVDPEIDALVSEREEVSDLRELVGEVLSKRERDILVLVEREGLSRTQVAAHFALTPRQVRSNAIIIARMGGGAG